MTPQPNEYQEALEWFVSLYGDNPNGPPIKAIMKALQAGAKAEERGVTLDDLVSAHVEGRILPKLPDGYGIFGATFHVSKREGIFKWAEPVNPAEVMHHRDPRSNSWSW